MAHDPVHLFVGVYDSAEAAERDFHNVVSLHRQGLVAAYDAALLERGEDGDLRVAHKKRSGHHVLAGFGVGALLTVLTPFVAIPFGLIGAGIRSAGAARRGQPAAQGRRRARRLARGGRRRRGRGQRQDRRGPPGADAAGGHAARCPGAGHRQGRVRRGAAAGGGRRGEARPGGAAPPGLAPVFETPALVAPASRVRALLPL